MFRTPAQSRSPSSGWPGRIRTRSGDIQVAGGDPLTWRVTFHGLCKHLSRLMYCTLAAGEHPWLTCATFYHSRRSAPLLSRFISLGAAATPPSRNCGGQIHRHRAAKGNKAVAFKWPLRSSCLIKPEVCPAAFLQGFASRWRQSPDWLNGFNIKATLTSTTIPQYYHSRGSGGITSRSWFIAELKHSKVTLYDIQEFFRNRNNY